MNNQSARVQISKITGLVLTVVLSVINIQLSGGSLPKDAAYTPVITPNGSTLPWKMVDGVKEFRLVVEEIEWEMAPGMVIKAWGYNGQTPGPTIEAVEGDRVRIYVTNKLPESTAVHWHGVILPSGMDGVSGLTQAGIQPGETFIYEFDLKQHGTQMYHSHGDEMTQIGLGSMGFFIIHPRKRENHIDRDYAIFLNEWFVDPGTSTPDANVMTDFNIFTFNGRAFPGTAPLVGKTGERIRIRIANVAQESHPIHLHGHSFKVVATDGGDIPESAQWPETTVLVAPGQTRDFEFIANPGDWALHCHRRHHPMNAMGHDIPNVLGVNQDGVEEKIRKLLPNYMAMGEKGMHEMAEMNMEGPPNTLPMMGGDGPFGTVAMGGMFTILKIRNNLVDGGDPGWYPNPKGTVASTVKPTLPVKKESQSIFVCPMHPEITLSYKGRCSKCGMYLVEENKK
ncbi:MAG: multicopper oxidase domain-containing protein [Candidatus Marinimicrobia bacterium]|nr:multicopper oxidase domain-containing protein [Candidatus Neomarinimicrobiota bacterium]